MSLTSFSTSTSKQRLDEHPISYIFWQRTLTVWLVIFVGRWAIPGRASQIASRLYKFGESSNMLVYKHISPCDVKKNFPKHCWDCSGWQQWRCLCEGVCHGQVHIAPFHPVHEHTHIQISFFAFLQSCQTKKICSSSPESVWASVQKLNVYQHANLLVCYI